ncbi:MAG: hypothetical protein KJN72_07895 [Woeseia sp.]|nr:hypothetical protein [Woeseia sp.]
MSSWISELKKRNVFKVGATYLVIAWLLLQVADVLVPNLDLPGWVPRFITILLLIGFPVALVIAWIFDLTPTGVQREAASRKDSYVLIGVAVLIALPLSWYLWDTFRSDKLSPLAQSIAVTPFENFSGNPSLNYLGDGIAEAVIDSIARVPELNVAARSRSFQVAEEAGDPASLAQELGVRYLVEGSIRQSGQRLRITAQLIEAERGFQLWSQTFERGSLEIFEAQDVISTSVAAALVDELGLDDAGILIARRDEPDPRAYDLYLRGRYIWHRRGSVPYAPAVEALAEAVAIDPNFARGWAALASAYLSWPSYSPEGYATWRLAKDAAMKALELDPSIPEVYSVLGTFAQFDGDLIEAHNLFREGVEKDPRSATAHYWYSEHLAQTGRLDEALHHVHTTLELDPTYIPPLVDTGFLYLMYGDSLRGAQTVERAWQAGLRNPVIWMAMFCKNILLKDFVAARAHINSSRLPEDQQELLNRFIDVEMGNGDREPLVRNLFVAENGMNYQIRTWLGARLGAHDEVLAMLWQRRSEGQLVDPRPMWGPGIDLVSQPGFVELALELGLVEYWQTVTWGEICRPTDGDIRCDLSRLTPARLSAIIDPAATDVR